MYSVLYTDDEPALLEIGKIFLERSGRFRVTTTTSAEEALALPALAGFDAIVSDYQMPGMDGIAFLKAVREKYGDIPFIIFTGRGREEVVIEAINSGADFYVQKGGDPAAQFADLAHKITLSIDRRRTQAELKAAYDKLSSSEEELRENYSELSKNRDALRESEEIFRLFIDHAPAALAMFDRDMHYLAVSRRWIADFHLEGQKLIGRSNYEVFPEITESLKEIHRRSLAGEVLSASEDRFERQDGTVQWHSWEVRPWFTASREIGGIIIFSENTTDCVLTRKALEESNQRFVHVAESAGEWIWEVDANGRYTYSSPVGQDILGYTPEEIVGTYFYDYFEADNRNSLKKAVLSVFKEKKTVRHFFNSCLHKDGHLVMLESSGSPILADDGTLLGYRGVDLDVTDRVHAEKALAQSRGRYRFMLMNAKDGIMVNAFTAKGPGKFIEVNDAACRILEMTRDELRDVSLFDLDTKETKQRTPGFIAELEKNHHAVFQIPFRTKTGVEKHLDISVSVFEFEGRPTLFSIVRDITALVTMEQALCESREQYRSLVENSPDIIIFVDPKGTITYANAHAAAAYNSKPAELIGKNLTDIFGEEGAGERYVMLNETLKSRTPLQKEIVVDLPSGKYWFDTRLLPVHDTNGSVQGVLGITRDITERKQMEDALRESEVRFRTLVETSPDMIWEIDPEGRFRYISPTVKTLMGYSPEELMGKSLTILAAEQGKALAVRKLKEHFVSGVSAPPFEVPARHRDGHDMTIEIRSSPLMDRGGIPAGFRGVARDVTDHRKAMKALSGRNGSSPCSERTRHDALQDHGTRLPRMSR